MAFMSEAALEQMLVDQLGTLGYSIAAEEVIGPDGSQPERESHDQPLGGLSAERGFAQGYLYEERHEHNARYDWRSGDRRQCE